MSLKNILFAAVVPVIFLSSCKKGPDDPALSLRSRKARVEGKWRIDYGTVDLEFVTSKGSLRERYSLASGELTMKRTANNGTPINYKGDYALTVNFTKDGKVEIAETFGPSIIKTSGTWDFISGIGKTKNKSGLVIRLNELIEGSTDDNLFNRMGTVCVYQIRELRNKKIVLDCEDDISLSQEEGDLRFASMFVLVQ